MSENGQRAESIQVEADFFQNQSDFPREQLHRYAGRYIAWNLNGNRILADGLTLDELEEKLIASGVAPNRVVSSFVPPPDAALL